MLLWMPSLEYKKIHAFYEDRRANRSGVLLMDHINEGALLLAHMCVNSHTINAFFLHPIFQDRDGYSTFSTEGHDPRTIMLATDYRYVANAYLPKDAARLPQTSLLWEVNQMLIADKIHNRWQFEKHLRGKIPNSDRLDEYFQEWFISLHIDEEQYQQMIGFLEP